MMLTYELISQLVTALMQEGEIDLNKEVETYTKSQEYSCNCPEDECTCEDDPDLQGDVEEALTCALETFFSTLSEGCQEEIKQAIKRFAVSSADEKKLAQWQHGWPIYGSISARI